MSRLRIFVLVAALVALATALAACGGGSESGSSEDPQKLIDNATLEGVKSGTLDLIVGVKSQGQESGDVKVSLSGPFQSRGKANLPELALSAKASGSVGGKPVKFDGGLTLLSDRAFVGYEGTEYEVDPTTFGFVKASLEQAQQRGNKEADVTACQEAAAGIHVGEFVDNLKNEGGAEVDGTSTTKVSGDLNPEGGVDALIKLTETPACSAQLEAAGQLPLGQLEKAKGELTKAVKNAHVDLYVGDDDIIRRMTAELTIEPKGTSGEKVELEIDVTLGAVNEEQEISAPANAVPLEGLFRKLNVNPLELLEAGSSGGGLGSLLEGVTGGESSGGSSGGSSSGGASAASQQAYLECLKGAETPADLQKCASLRE